MLVGLISDTHDDRERTERALELLDERAPEAILHAGDLNTGELVSLFGRHWTWLAQGNMDRPDAIRDAIEESGADISYGVKHDVDVGEATIGLIHGDDEGRLQGMIESGAYELVVHGHTHEFRDERVGSTRVVNPGAVHRASTPSVCVYNVEEDTLERLELE
jgi:putative phosphoesterase